MTIDVRHPDFVDLRARIRENPAEFVPVVGAGLSRECGLPLWGELRDALADEAAARLQDQPVLERDGYNAKINRIREEDDLWYAFFELNQLLTQQAFERVIQQRLTIPDSEKIPKVYALLWKLRVKGIVSFNLDKCAIESYAKLNRSVVDYASSREVAKFKQFLTGTQNFVFHPHGLVGDPSSWVLSSLQRDQLLSSESYVTFMSSLCHSKHLIILGFDLKDFAFTYVLQKALGPYLTSGSKHYAFLPNPEPGLIQDLGAKNVAVIPYSPSDPDSHEELKTALENISIYLPTDRLASSVYLGAKVPPDKLPNDEELVAMPVEEARQLLNGAVSYIIPSDREPSPNDLQRLRDFYRNHIRAVHMAWLVQPDSECDRLHGYKVQRTVGRGAFGQVYEVENTETRKRAAAKILLPEVRGDLDYLNSFRRGVKSMRILTDKHVEGMVRIINAYEIPACVLMDFVDGLTLREAVVQGALESLSSCLEVLSRVSEIVHKAHSLEERVLHRDLKPENIVLRDYYTFSDALDVVVLDFDLSWHKGASELSVVHGARAQGYAAPEQTATGRRTGESTRHTAVDVFGLGMLAYFLLCGEDPRPNQHKFPNFAESIQENIKRRFAPRWTSIPRYISETVKGCTQDKQADRIPFSVAMESFRTAHRMVSLNELDADHPVLLLEIASGVDPVESEFEVHEFGRHIVATSHDRSKKIELRLSNDKERLCVDVVLSKVRSEHDHRNVMKYLPAAKDKVVSKLKSAGLKDVYGEIGLGRLDIHARAPLRSSVSISQIQALAKALVGARIEMELS